VFRRPLEWAHSRGFPAGVLVAVLVTGVVATAAAFLNNPIVGGVVAMITAAAGLVVTEQQRRIGAAHDLRKRWAAAVDPVTGSVVAPKDSVAALLRPELGVVPYNNVHIEQLSGLQRWAQSTGSLALRFLAGGAGCGKTRTAGQLARRLQDGQGWQCGVARPGKEAQAVETAVESRIPTLLIVDHGLGPGMAEALAPLARQRDGSHVRVLVVTRNVDVWQRQISACADDVSVGLVLAAERTELGTLSAGPHGHRQQFEQAIFAFARARGIDAPHVHLDLTDPDASVLAVHTTALLAVLEAEFSTTRALGNRRPCDSDVFGHLLRHEEQFWRLSWRARGIDRLPDKTYQQIVTVAFLLGPEHERLRRIPVLADASAERLAHIGEWLEEQYPTIDGLLAAALVTDVLAGDSALAEAVLTDVPVESLGPVLAILTDACCQFPAARSLLQQTLSALPRDQLPNALGLAWVLGDPLDRDLASVIDNESLELEQLNALDDALVADGATPWCAATLLRARLRVVDQDMQRVELFDRLIRVLRAIGECVAGVDISRARVHLLRKLIRRGEKDYVPALVEALDCQTSLLHDLGRNKPAIGISNEAVKLARELAGEQAQYLGDLCKRLNNNGVVLHALGKNDKAQTIINEAVEIGRFASTGDQPLPGLAEALNSLVVILLERDSVQEAHVPALEAVDCFQRLLVTNTEYRSYLARALMNLGAVLIRLNDERTAMQVLRESAAHWRTSSFGKPHMAPELVDTLINLGNCYGSLQRNQQALATWQEALPWARRLATHHPRHQARYFAVLCGFGRALSWNEDHGMALNVLRDAIDLSEELTRGGWLPKVEIPQIHEHLGDALLHASRHVDALDAWRTALSWWRRLSKTDSHHRTNEMTLLYRISALHERRGDSKHALETADEARNLARELGCSTFCTCGLPSTGTAVTLPLRGCLTWVDHGQS
jgi:tetratricopeptide (TPR) repeat protein